jgi:hypothetical protein
MIQFLENALAIVAALWNIGNYWMRRIIRVLICILFGWPIVLTAAAALSDSTGLKGYLAVIPFFAFIVFLWVFRDPFVIPILRQSQDGKKFENWVLSVLGFEVLLGVYFAVMPIDAKPGLAPVLLGIALSAGLLSNLSDKKVRRVFMTALAIGFAWLTILFWTADAKRKEVTQKHNQTDKSQVAQAKVEPGTTVCSPGTIEVNQTMVIPLDTCVSWVEVAFAPNLKTIDSNQNLGLVWPRDSMLDLHGQRVWIEGNQNLPLPPQNRKFGVWSDRKGMLEIKPKYGTASTTAQAASTAGTSTEVPPEEPGWTYVRGEVRHVNEYTCMLAVANSNGETELYAPGRPVKSMDSENFLGIGYLMRGSDVRIRLNKKKEVDRIDILRDWRVKQNEQNLKNLS